MEVEGHREGQHWQREVKRVPMHAERTAQGEIQQWFERYADDIYRYARYSAPKTIDATDVVQEVFLRAYKSWGRFRRDANPRTWLYQIARHYIYDLLRKKRIEQTYLEQQSIDLSDVSISMDTLVELEDAIGELKPDQRQVFILRAIEDFSVEDTARILGFSKAKVKTTFHRAQRQLRNTLGESEENIHTMKEGERDGTTQ